MAKDTYLVDMYNKLKGTSKANFNNHITESQNVCSVFESSLKNVKERVTKAEWDDDIETLVELNLEEVTKFKNYCNSYVETVIIPLAEKTELLENRLKAYVEGSKKEESAYFEVKDTYFENAFKVNKLDDWIAEPYSFRKIVDEYYKPTDELLDDGSASVDRLVDEIVTKANTYRKNNVPADEILAMIKDKIESSFVRAKQEDSLEKATSGPSEVIMLDDETMRKNCYETIKDIATLLDDEFMLLQANKGLSDAGSKISEYTVRAKAVGGGASDGSGDILDSIDEIGVYTAVDSSKQEVSI